MNKDKAGIFMLERILSDLSNKSQRISNLILLLSKHNSRNNPNAKLDKSIKSLLFKRTLELVKDIDESGIIVKDTKDVDQLRSVFGNEKYKKILDILVFLGPKIKITDEDVEKFSRPDFPLIAKKDDQYTLYYYVREKKESIQCVIDLNKESIGSLFSNYVPGTLQALTLSVQDRIKLFENHSLLLTQQENGYKFNSLLFSLGMIYIIDKNKYTFELLAPTLKETYDDKNYGVNTFLKTPPSEVIEKESGEKIFYNGIASGALYAAQHFTFQNRMKVSIKHGDTDLTSPYDLFHGQDEIRYFLALANKQALRSPTLKRVILKGIERHNSARSFRPMMVKNLLDYLRKKDPSIDIKAVQDPCGGWGDRLAAFLLDNEIDDISINDANPEMEEPYKKIVAEYNKKEKKVELTFYPFEQYPEDALIAKSNKMDLVFTSPPYFNKEKYNGDQSSYRLYPEYSSWRENFLIDTIKNSYVMLKHGHYMVFYVANIVYGAYYAKTHPIVNDTEIEMKRYCKDVTRIAYGNLEYQGRRRRGTVETFLIGKVNKESPFPLPIVTRVNKKKRKQPSSGTKTKSAKKQKEDKDLSKISEGDIDLFLSFTKRDFNSKIPTSIPYENLDLLLNVSQGDFKTRPSTTLKVIPDEDLDLLMHFTQSDLKPSSETPTDEDVGLLMGLTSTSSSSVPESLITTAPVVGEMPISDNYGSTKVFVEKKPVDDVVMSVQPSVKPSTEYPLLDSSKEKDVAKLKKKKDDSVQNMIEVDGVIRFQCTFTDCNKSYTKKTNLKRHQRKHYSKPDKACSDCGKCFYENSELKSHQKTHLTKKQEQKQTPVPEPFTKSDPKTSSSEAPKAIPEKVADLSVSVTQNDCKTISTEAPKAIPADVVNLSLEISQEDLALLSDFIQYFPGTQNPFSSISLQLDDVKTVAGFQNMQSQLLIQNILQDSISPPSQSMMIPPVVPKPLITTAPVMGDMPIPNNYGRKEYPMLNLLEQKDLDTPKMKEKIDPLKKKNEVKIDGVIRYQCNFSGCDRHFGKTFTRNRHQKEHNSKPEKACTHCGKCFHENSALKRHQSVHKNTEEGQKEYQKEKEKYKKQKEKEKEKLPLSPVSSTYATLATLQSSTGALAESVAQDSRLPENVARPMSPVSIVKATELDPFFGEEDILTTTRPEPMSLTSTGIGLFGSSNRQSELTPFSNGSQNVMGNK